MPKRLGTLISARQARIRFSTFALLSAFLESPRRTSNSYLYVSTRKYPFLCVYISYASSASSR